ncbi:MAG TPA: hypothetical protein VI895_09370 [Bdellovibrionota bacterium]|nr:hypothetical protein [Bdellovibrionota bacterium]
MDRLAADPEQLGPGQPDGPPADEYDPEVREITRFSIGNWTEILKNPTLLKVEINRVWNVYFDHDTGHARALATAIIREMKKQGPQGDKD